MLTKKGRWSQNRIAEGLLHHYAVIIREESQAQFGVITRADLLELVLS